jgi:hypothetical protein
VYSWDKGTPPRGERESHLLEALAFARGAAEHFPKAQAFKQWLMTPVAPGQETPLRLMAQRRWRPLRGLLFQVRANASTLSTPQPLRGVARSLDRTESRRARQGLSPPPAREDLESIEEEMPGEPHAGA